MMRTTMFQKYTAYKDSGVEWLGEIPEHWEVRRLKYVTKINTNTLPENTPKTFAFNYVDIGSVSFENGIERIEYFEFKNSPSRARRKAKKGNTIISTVRTYLKAIDFITTEKSEYIYSTGFAILEPQELVEKFLFHFVRSSVFTEQVTVDSKGMSYPAINSTDLSRLFLAIPTIEEQTAIAAFLDDKTAKIDRAIAQKEKMIALLKERKQIIIQNAVTKGLNPNAKMKDSGVEWIGEIPEGWDVKKLKYLGRIISGYAFPSDGFKSEGVRVMKISNIQTMNIDWSDESFVNEDCYSRLPQFQIKEGDLVFALTRPIISTGIKASIVPQTTDKILLNQRNAVLKPKSLHLKKWFYYVILDNGFKQVFNNQIDFTGQQPNISPNDIGIIEIPLPPIEEINTIVAHIETQSAKIDKAIGLQEQQIEKLKELKATLIDGAVTGKIKII